MKIVRIQNTSTYKQLQPFETSFILSSVMTSDIVNVLRRIENVVFPLSFSLYSLH